MQTNPVNWLVLPALNHTLYLHTTVSHSEPHAQRSHHGRQVGAPSKQKTPVEELSFNLPEIPSAIGCGIPVLVAGRTPAMRQTDFRHGPTSSPRSSCWWSLTAGPHPGLVLGCTLSRGRRSDALRLLNPEEDQKLPLLPSWSPASD